MGKSISIELLICPNCKSKLENTELNKITCIQCKADFDYKNQKPVFEKLDSESITDDFDRLKSIFKTWPKLYSFFIEVLSPVFLQMRLRRFIKNNVNDNTVAVNIGSGNSNISDKIINIDIFQHQNVNLCCDIEDIPIADASVDVVINIAVLEHIKNPENAVNEIHRILKNGGKVFTYFPFIAPFHASPHDYSRRTTEGLKILHKQFQINKLYIGAGPTSGFLWVFQEWISLILSFGVKKIHHYVYLLVMVLTFPLKYLDVLLSKYPASINISSGFVIIAEKNDSI
jgi:SAM-dependent methyltransferase